MADPGCAGFTEEIVSSDPRLGVSLQQVVSMPEPDRWALLGAILLGDAGLMRQTMLPLGSLPLAPAPPPGGAAGGGGGPERSGSLRKAVPSMTQQDATVLLMFKYLKALTNTAGIDLQPVEIGILLSMYCVLRCSSSPSSGPGGNGAPGGGGLAVPFPGGGGAPANYVDAAPNCAFTIRRLLRPFVSLFAL